jgi:Type II secretory pathway, component ExeA (predicted ATPase)
MYLRFYGLREEPFELTPNPKFLFTTVQHAEAIANLQYGLSAAKAVTLLIGEAGTGKTTVLRAALESEPCRHVKAVHLTNPQLSRQEFIETLARSFALSPGAHSSKASLLAELETVVHERRRRGQISALIVDEGQRLSEELLEEIRLLANIETDTEKLLPLVLAGQPELSDRLNETGLRQLKQRVALRCEIKPFELADTAAYIASRIRTAGGDARRLFTREAVTLIQEYSRGIPRSISVICDNALISGFAVGRQPVGRDIVDEVAHDFDLQGDSRGNVETRARVTMSTDHGNGSTHDRSDGADPVLTPPSIDLRPAEGENRAEDSTPGVLDGTVRRQRFSLFGRS